jgi:hypothetical protein
MGVAACVRYRHCRSRPCSHDGFAAAAPFRLVNALVHVKVSLGERMSHVRKDVARCSRFQVGGVVPAWVRRVPGTASYLDSPRSSCAPLYICGRRLAVKYFNGIRRVPEARPSSPACREIATPQNSPGARNRPHTRRNAASRRLGPPRRVFICRLTLDRSPVKSLVPGASTVSVRLATTASRQSHQHNRVTPVRFRPVGGSPPLRGVVLPFRITSSFR